jgi:signal transduction histidine kinase
MSGIVRRVRRALAAMGHGVALCGLSLLAALLALGLAAAVASVVWVVFVPAALLAVRILAGWARRLTRWSSGVAIGASYRPAPPAGDGLEGRLRRATWVLADPATWRDVRWLVAAPLWGVGVAGLPAAMVTYGLYALARPTALPAGDGGRFTATALGVGLVAFGPLIAPRAVRWHAWGTRWLLAPSAKAALRQRVRHLTETRSDALDAQAAELRRIERDLHDGAQARLVSVTMTLSAVDHLLDVDPPAARTLLAEARAASATALNELRDLVRGVYPPVLADRGLGDAVRALALDAGRGVTVSIELPGRPPPAVESAAYFALAEALTNAVKHAAATRVALELRYSAGHLRMSITDDGRGGADPAGGTGLRGIRRRLVAFDGTLAVDSPPGGPTTVTMEVPCGLSSPKTTLSSVTD